MANLDIAIVMFCLIVIMILDILSIGLTSRWFAGFGFLFAISSIAYFVANYSFVIIGTFTIPFDLFLTAWVLLPILGSFVLILTKGKGM